MKNKRITVWDVPVRLLHWTLAIAIATAWFTSSQTGALHEYIGYAAATLVGARLAWGFAGNRYARFSQFLRAPQPGLRYLREVWRGRAARYLGHNPLGGWMVLALLGCTLLLAVSGWALGTERLWGYAWPVRVHVALAWLQVLLIALHVGGVAFTSWQHRENLIAAMFSGDKAAPQAGDID